MRHYKLPFSFTLERRYTDINIDDFLREWKDSILQSSPRILSMDNELNLQLAKFNTYDVTPSEMVDLALRYALGKREFKRMIAQLIELKQIENL